MIRVLFLPSWYPSDDNPVLGTFVREHAKAAALSHDVLVLYVLETVGESNSSVTVTRVNDHLVEVRSTYRLRRFRRLFPFAYVWAWLKGVRRLPTGWVPDVIHVHVGYPAGLGALLGKLRWRAPIVYTEQAGPLDEKILATRLSRRVVPLVAHLAELGAPVSNFLAQDMSRHGILPNALQVLPNTVDLQTFTGTGMRAAYRGEKLRLLTAALLVPAKGLEHAIDCLPLLVGRGLDPELRLAGSGPLRASLEQRAVAVGVADRVTFLGLISKEALAEEMRLAHIMVMSSDRETFSAVIVESMAAGLPVVATRSGGPEELVTPSTGVLVDPGSPLTLAEGITDVATEWTRFDGGPVTARDRFSTEAVGERLGELYQMVTT